MIVYESGNLEGSTRVDVPGLGRISVMVTRMLGKPPNMYVRLCWLVFAPLLVLVRPPPFLSLSVSHSLSLPLCLSVSVSLSLSVSLCLSLSLCLSPRLALPLFFSLSLSISLIRVKN